MDMLELLESHPKTALVVKQWFLDKMLDSIENESVPEDFKQMVREQGIDNDKVAGVLEGAPRSLFDVFDSQKVYIEIHVNSPGKVFFTYSINNVVGEFTSDIRKETETEAVIEAFKQLEAKL